ncbi:MAG: nuclear transport factor 2 family protein [Myxococcaceae bacterium]|nr:nuclear transport factor 2 family protein [Myxococcaceae bacterium]
MSTDTARALGQAWLEAFNQKDLERLLALYADDCTHHSPKLRVQQPHTKGEVKGKAALRAWWAGAFERMPSLRYEGFAVTASSDRVVLEYWRHAPGEEPMPVAESFEVKAGRITTSRVYHG